MPSFLSFVSDQWKQLPVIPTSGDCEGKTYVITGANTGLGFECAKHLVELSAKRVIIGVRTIKKGEEAKAKLEEGAGRKGVVDVWHLDLSSHNSVKEFGERICNLDRVDAVIENAGVAIQNWSVAEGLETTLTVNVVSTMLLAAIVLPKLQESAKKFGTSPNLVLVGSEVAFEAKGELEKIEGDILEGLNQGVMGDKRYPTSKLLLLYAVRQFALLHPVSETGVTINYLNPGLCKTELSHDSPLSFRIIITIMLALFGRTPEVGSRTQLHAATAGKESHGKYLAACEIRENQVESWVTDDTGRKMQLRVWDSIASRLTTAQPGCV